MIKAINSIAFIELFISPFYYTFITTTPVNKRVGINLNG